MDPVNRDRFTPAGKRALDVEHMRRQGFLCFYIGPEGDLARWHEGVSAAGADPVLAELRTYADGVAVVFYLPPFGGAA